MEPPDCRRMERSASFPTIFPKKEVQLIGTEGTRLLRGNVAKGNPAGVEASRADRPRKASAWSGSQRSSFTNKKT
ncbi:hypothetical protein ACQKOM_00080 [Peribacillus frigoritolerans]|uniref:hypothetical protein n=1 Tax=Peribacillus frigoritolerans TaxID=450367 RepID=UPI003D0285B8